MRAAHSTTVQQLLCVRMQHLVAKLTMVVISTYQLPLIGKMA
jgi:hypothetical protein